MVRIFGFLKMNNMKQIVFFLLLLPGFVSGQTIVSDTAYVVDTVIGGVKYFQEVTAITYDNGQSTMSTGPRLDSVSFVEQAFNSARSAILPVSQAIKLLSQVGESRRRHRYYSDMLQSVTGSDYLTGTQPNGIYQDLVTPFYGGNVWRVFYDSAGVKRSFFVYYITANNIGREITNPVEVINGTEPPALVPGTKDRRIRFFPYTRDLARCNLLLRDQNGALQPHFIPLRDVAAIRTIVDDDGVDTGRTVFVDETMTFTLVRIPPQ